MIRKIMTVKQMPAVTEPAVKSTKEKIGKNQNIQRGGDHMAYKNYQGKKRRCFGHCLNSLDPLISFPLEKIPHTGDTYSLD